MWVDRYVQQIAFQRIVCLLEMGYKTIQTEN